MTTFHSFLKRAPRARAHRHIAQLLVLASLVSAAWAQWPQWGGPNRNFMVESKGLPGVWPVAGPRVLWSRPLGEGHSSIVVDGGRLVTMYRPVAAPTEGRSEEEVVIALDATSGKTLWEYRYAAPTAGVDFSRGAGPHATPLLVGDRVIAAGSLKQIFALDKQTGKLLWSHDLLKEYGASRPGRGYACSPIAYKNTVIVTAGGAGQAVMAFDQRTGALVWKNQSFAVAPASPILISVDGQEQLVVFAQDQVAGLDPNGGALLWSHPHQTEYGLNISTPVWGEGNLLFISSAYNAGSRMLQLSRAQGKTSVNELWFTNRMRVHIGSVIRLGDTLYGSSGDFGPAFLTAVDAKTGNVKWQDRSFSRSMLLHADGKLIILDEDGNLGLATVSPAGLKVLTRAEVLARTAWTVPTLVGTRLYLRDRRMIRALDLAN